MLNLIWLAALLAVAPAAVLAQDSQAAPAPAADEAADAEEVVEEAPKPAPRRRPKAAPSGAPAMSAPMKGRLNEIAKVHRNQLAFAAAEHELWKNFWTKLRDERGLFEMRLVKQREGFLDSLRSLDPGDHHQGLTDFEALQGNAMRSFEETQAKKIADFTAEREGKLKEFGAAQEAERARLAQESLEIWEQQKAKLDIQPPSPDREKEKEKQAKKGKRKG